MQDHDAKRTYHPESTMCFSRQSGEDLRHLLDDDVSWPVAKGEHSTSSRSVLYVSLCTNLLVVILLFFVVSRQLLWKNKVCIPSSSGIRYDQLSTYHHHTPYWGANDSLADALWESLSTDPMVVAVSDVWAKEHSLPKSARWPWDPARGRYFIRAYHELHCLKYIRRYVTDLQRAHKTALIGSHVLHCIDSLRQSIMCRADDTLMPTSDDTKFAIGDSEQTQCRDWDKLAEWALAPERHACHKSLDDYRLIHHPIERYAFCPEWSPYRSVAEKYFDDHGHQSAWD